MTSSSGNIGYEKALAEVAKEVDRLVMRNPVMDYFREKIRPLGLRWQDYVSDCNRAREKYIMHWEKVKANPAWQDKNAGPPQEGWEWAPYYFTNLDDGPGYNVPAKLLPEYMAGLRKWINRNEQKLKGLKEKGCNPSSLEYRNVQGAVSEQKSELADVQSKLKHQDISSTWVPVPWGWWGYLEDLGQEDVFGCWRPPEQEIAENPLSNLVAEGPDTALPRPKDKAEEYERYYVILTAIHDNKLPECGRIDNGIWAQELAEHVWFRLTDAQPYGPPKHFIEAALERVKVDIEEKCMSVSKKPAGTTEAVGATEGTEAAGDKEKAENMDSFPQSQFRRDVQALIADFEAKQLESTWVRYTKVAVPRNTDMRKVWPILWPATYIQQSTARTTPETKASYRSPSQVSEAEVKAAIERSRQRAAKAQAEQSKSSQPLQAPQPPPSDMRDRLWPEYTKYEAEHSDVYGCVYGVGLRASMPLVNDVITKAIKWLFLDRYTPDAVPDLQGFFSNYPEFRKTPPIGKTCLSPAIWFEFIIGIAQEPGSHIGVTPRESPGGNKAEDLRRGEMPCLESTQTINHDIREASVLALEYLLTFTPEYEPAPVIIQVKQVAQDDQEKPSEDSGQQPPDSKAQDKPPAPCQKKAYDSYQWLLGQQKDHPNLIPTEDGKRFTLQMYQYVKQSSPQYHDDDGNPIKMPGFDSWKRYINAYEQFLNGPKNTPRAGREHGRSVAENDEL